jgi:hypothetical protein
MSPFERAQKKAKLFQRATDHRGNEHERKLAMQGYQRMCAAEKKSGKAGSGPTPQEFNRVERGVIRVGTVVVVGASMFAHWLKTRPKRKLRRGRG